MLSLQLVVYSFLSSSLNLLAIKINDLKNLTALQRFSQIKLKQKKSYQNTIKCAYE